MDGMVPAMMVLALYGMLRAIGATTGVVFMAVGKPEIRTKTQFAALILLAILIYPLTAHWGILGASIAVTIYALIINPFVVYAALNIVKSDYKKPVKLIMLPLTATLLTIFVIFAIKTYGFIDISLISLLSLIVVGVLIYILITYLFDTVFNYGSKLLIQEQLAALFREQNGK